MKHYRRICRDLTLDERIARLLKLRGRVGMFSERLYDLLGCAADDLQHGATLPCHSCGCDLSGTA